MMPKFLNYRGLIGYLYTLDEEESIGCEAGQGITDKTFNIFIEGEAEMFHASTNEYIKRIGVGYSTDDLKGTASSPVENLKLVVKSEGLSFLSVQDAKGASLKVELVHLKDTETFQLPKFCDAIVAWGQLETTKALEQLEPYKKQRRLTAAGDTLVLVIQPRS